MATVKISGAPPFNGEYELDLGRPFNGWEFHLIKKLSGIRAGELEDAIEAEDYDLLVAMAVIALVRAGKVPRKDEMAAANVLMEADGGSLEIQPDEEEVDQDGPPSEAPPTSGSSESGAESSEPSGNGSSEPGGHLASIPRAIGNPG